MGPGTVTRDRFDYAGAVGESWKTQMLLNLVKIRYGDIPVFMDIGQVVAGYSLQRSLAATASIPTFYLGPAPNAQTTTFGGAAGITYNDSPTITYTPLAGERFARSMMGSIPPASIMNVLQAGFPVDIVLRLAVQSINGIDNRRVAGGISREHVRPANPEFYVLLEQLGRIQNSGDIGVRVGPKGSTLILVFRRSHSAAVRQAVRNVTNILGVDPDAKEFRVVYGAVPADNKEIAIVSRSIFEVLLDISSTIVVPETHVAERRVGATAEGDLGPQGTIPPLIKITSSSERPSDAFVAIPYHGNWFSHRRPRPRVEEPLLVHPASVHLRGDREQGHRSRPVDPDNAMKRPDRQHHPMRRQFVLKGMGLLAVGLAGGALDARPAAAQGRSIVIGCQEQPDWLLFVARDLKLFEKAGLSPTFVKFDGGPPMMEAMRDGRLDLASVGSVAFLIGLSREHRLDDDRDEPGRRLRRGARGPEGQRHPHADRRQGRASRPVRGRDRAVRLPHDAAPARHPARPGDGGEPGARSASCTRWRPARSMPPWCRSRGCIG